MTSMDNHSTTPKKKRPDAAYNERRMRETLLGAVKKNGWTGRGVAGMVKLSGMARGTARHTLDRMEKDLQIYADRERYRIGFLLLLEHPAWSTMEKALVLAQGRAYQQARARKGPSLLTENTELSQFCL
jgi:hypothetical protein